MSELLEPERAEETVREPAKGWDNWWRIVAPIGFPLGTKFRMGPYPSKDVAETLARVELNALFTRCGLTDDCVDYLGAYPEGERP